MTYYPASAPVYRKPSTIYRNKKVPNLSAEDPLCIVFGINFLLGNGVFTI